MSLSTDLTAQLSIYAQLGVGFAGFAGVIGAFSQFRIHAQATAFRVRAMVSLALAIALFSLLPLAILNFGVEEAATWRICAGLLAVAAGAMVTMMTVRARMLYRNGMLFRVAAYLLSAVAFSLIVPLFATSLGWRPELAAGFYVALMFWAAFVCAYHFIMLMIAVRLEDSE